jgi:hypothetical protein
MYNISTRREELINKMIAFEDFRRQTFIPVNAANGNPIIADGKTTLTYIGLDDEAKFVISVKVLHDPLPYQSQLKK